jgi:hypothetical protein
MSREVKYRRYAAALVDLAKRAATPADKFRLLVMAEAWLKLADKIAGLTKQRASSCAPSLPQADRPPHQLWSE